MDEIIAHGGEFDAKLKQGDRVIIQSGPFEEYQAIFDTRLPGTTRVRVLLKMLNQRILPVELDETQIHQK